MARLAALEVPGVARVARGGPAWRAFFRGAPVAVRIRRDAVFVRVWVVARPGVDLAETGRQARRAVGGAIARLLGLQIGSVTVIVDGVGG
jgi:uncharacterized alkaline shock family protein YloU